MDERYVIGIDPGFASFGLAVVQLYPAFERVIAMDVVRTKRSNIKSRILEADDSIRRVREISTAFMKYVAEYSPVAFCAESMSYPRNASSAAKVAMSWGAIASIAERNLIPVFQASPQTIRNRLTGAKKASKDKIRDVLIDMYGDKTDFDKLLGHLPWVEHEHAWDALASVVACLDAEAVRMVRKYLNTSESNNE
jgi:Holliday junction resolvasome RuvABC endonuclease subunit